MDFQALKNGVSYPPSPETPLGQIWKPDLYKLQEEAPKPNAIQCIKHVLSCPPQYSWEFHGLLSHSDAAKLLKNDGDYLTRISGSVDNPTYTLSLRFDGKVKHYKLYFDGQHYLKEKRYDRLDELVADGLVTMYLDSRAGPYIHAMSERARYERSAVYLTLTRLRPRVPADPPVTYDKPHAFRTHTFKGLNWCEFCSNFLWGFTAQGVKCEDCGFSAHFKCSEKVPGDCWPAMKYVRSVFGADLTTLVRAHRSVRPFVVDKCVAEVDARGLSIEGIYRLSGFADEIDSLRHALERDGISADVSCNSIDNINVVAGILKLYFRLLPIPLISFEVHPLLVKAVQYSSFDEQMNSIKNALKLLPPAHYNTLKFLMAHLHRVEMNNGVNKMTAQNLGTVFAPTLMPVPDMKTSNMIPDMTSEITILCLMIENEERIFVSNPS